ncbi:hypothetical protein BDN72DRAFT_894923 [Pluteus cervinus]|uniref:Uncharacterized protein n=1 Tax=Pluteus cervinus TaxID=181527 RepID=A0ACD3B3L9_9AGAR|nr:hypothetical protein BDN72DRAFT_894923 [Pluteus cervinus]
MTQCPNYIHVIDLMMFWDDSLKLNQCFDDDLVTLVKPHIVQEGAERNWSIADACALTTVIISAVSVLRDCRNYTTPREQRQILRILYTPPISAVVSFCSYRFFREYPYYSSIPAIALRAFVMLSHEDAASIHHAYDRRRATERWTFSQMQYVFVRIAAHIISEKLGNSRESGGFISNFIFLSIKCAIFVSASVALEGQLWSYGLMSGELMTKRPLAKSLCVVLTFMLLEGPGTLQMVLLSALMMWAYSASEDKERGSSPTGIWRPLWDSYVSILLGGLS